MLPVVPSNRPSNGAFLQLWIHLMLVCSRALAGQKVESCGEELEEFSAVSPKWAKTLLPKNYSNSQHPSKNGCPASVLVEYVPLAIGDISVLTMTIEIDIAIWVKWSDNRLVVGGNDYVGFSGKEMLRYWSPHLQFRGCKNCEPLQVDREEHKLWLHHGYLTFFVRVAEKFSCKFDLSAYPMDTQICVVEIEAIEEMSAVRLKDISKPDNLTSVVKAIELTEFKITSVTQRNCSKGFLSDEHSCVSFGFILKRQTTYHLMLTYIPSMLIVILSWFSFWLDAETSAPRVTLGLTSLLTLATQFANAQKNLPAISYVKAIDVWMFVCMFMVFASLLEFAIANNIARLNRLRTVIPIKVAPIYRNGPRILKKPVKPHNTKQDGGGPIIDKFARVLFPTAYFIFNICYWGYYFRFLLVH